MTGIGKGLRNNLWQCCSKYVLLVIKIQNVIINRLQYILKGLIIAFSIYQVSR